MTTVTVSSKGQLVLPARVRARLGLGAGARLELQDEADGVRLRVVLAVPATSLAALAGMVTAKSKGKCRRLTEFDAAATLARRPR